VRKVAPLRVPGPLLLAAVAIGVACCTEGSWDLLERNVRDVQYAYRMVLTIDNTTGGENLFDFPLLVKLTPGNFRYDHLARQGADIAFYGADGAVLPHEVETWDPLDASLLWVRVPVIPAGAATTVEMRYGSSLSGEPERPAEVWSNGYLAVWHLGEPAGPCKDSSGHHVDLQSPYAATGHTAATALAAQIGGGQDLGAASSGLVVPAAAGLTDLNPLTFEAWVKPAAAGLAAGDRLFAKGPFILWTPDPTSSQELQFELDFTGVGTLMRSWTGCWTPGAWTHLALTWEGTSSYVGLRLYREGSVLVPSTMNNGTGSPRTGSADNLCVGNTETASPTRCLNGVYDEVRISSTPRSPAWLAAQYRSMTNDPAFITYGPEESIPP
jgi:biopolymer transport protein ExbB